MCRHAARIVLHDGSQSDTGQLICRRDGRGLNFFSLYLISTIFRD
jgi:hypothetical protein